MFYIMYLIKEWIFQIFLYLIRFNKRVPHELELTIIRHWRNQVNC